MKVCVTCGSLVRHWTDKETNVVHFQCVGCRKKWIEGDQPQDRRFNAQDVGEDP